jgi:hypothetical protein
LIVFQQTKYSPEVYLDPSVSMTVPNENSSPEFKDTPYWIVGLTGLAKEKILNSVGCMSTKNLLKIE